MPSLGLHPSATSMHSKQGLARNVAKQGVHGAVPQHDKRLNQVWWWWASGSRFCRRHTPMLESRLNWGWSGFSKPVDNIKAQGCTGLYRPAGHSLSGTKLHHHQTELAPSSPHTAAQKPSLQGRHHELTRCQNLSRSHATMCGMGASSLTRPSVTTAAGCSGGSTGSARRDHR